MKKLLCKFSMWIIEKIDSHTKNNERNEQWFIDWQDKLNLISIK